MSRRREGIGQDQEIISLKRRSLINTLLVIIAVVFALLLALYVTNDRTGSLLVTADQPNAMVMINGAVTTTPAGTLMKKLRLDTYTVSVSLEGFQPQPAEQIIKIEAGKTALLSFALTPYQPDSAFVEKTFPKPSIIKKEIIPPKEQPDYHTDVLKTEKRVAPDAKPLQPNIVITPKQEPVKETPQATGTLTIITQPVKGSITVDDQFQGIGEVTMSNAEFGEAVIKFGEVQGYKTPPPQKVWLSSAKPTLSVEGIYLPLIFITAYLDQNGRSITQKCDVRLGYAFSAAEFQQDNVAGPAVKFLDEVKTFAWEIGYAFSNRNPPGQDVVEVVFELPENFDSNKPLELRLYGFASDRKYPFAMSGKVGIDVLVNDKSIQNGFNPKTKLSVNAGSGFDNFAVSGFLTVGRNVIRIQSSPASRCFYYLTKIVIL
ncbi:MAG: PEGA domain-containing protein [bacterium]|nr:PEGA domain-containing protein [bacterium]